MTKKERQELFAKLDNAIFPSREDNGVEHVDMRYKDFMHFLRQLADI